jgi:hypothetical protein
MSEVFGYWIGFCLYTVDDVMGDERNSHTYTPIRLYLMGRLH